MALVIRMRQQGANSRQHFRIVVTDIRSPRDGKYVEKLGWYNPFGPSEKNLSIDVDRLQYWVDLGAQMSDRVKSLVGTRAREVIQKLTARSVAKREKKRIQSKKRRQKKK